MPMMLGPRVVIIGNSGSGKSTLARDVARRLDCRAHDLDRIHWQEGVSVKRDEDQAMSMVSAVASEPRWVIEGVFGWLAAVALPFATSLVWLDMPWTVCSDGLASRGPSTGATAVQHAELLAWAEAYWHRSTSSSFAGHLTMFDSFDGKKHRLLERSDISALFAG
ncbi:ATP-binding cassette domain-containing protein [Tardiphaga sp. vice304]|uniref:ATP-binding cassette domain-containing protein n=1 Tax=Tardiphaga sp. vice304 TaxID=2592817 RepID=UPI0011621EF4|nr:ATP-binding cassette domain-containing protein [Tardiphaga sp. vice304]QDM28468.1 ATP-binding cassette domain-containing protein [Tardiphaga sp. vice304]